MQIVKEKYKFEIMFYSIYRLECEEEKEAREKRNMPFPGKVNGKHCSLSLKAR